jgi:hypothetical protein
MPSTYEPIATTTLGSNQTNVTFSSIPSTYTDLILISNAKAVGLGGNQWYFLTFNSDTNSNYSMTFLSGNGSSASSGRYSNRSDGIFIGDTDNSDYMTMITHIMNYTNTTTFKTVLSRSSDSSDAVKAIVGLWRKTPEAITSLKITNQDISNNLASGSTFTLYGIKAA